MAAEIIKVQKGTGPVGKYVSLFSLQAAGFGLVIIHGVPIYRQMAVDFSKHQPEEHVLWWGVAAVILMQSGYWLRVLAQPAMPRFRNVVLAHVVAFTGRLSFAFGTAAFTLMFLVRFEELPVLPRRVLLLLALLFSLFCFALELERLGRALAGTGVNPETKPVG